MVGTIIQGLIALNVTDYVWHNVSDASLHFSQLLKCSKFFEHALQAIIFRFLNGGL